MLFLPPVDEAQNQAHCYGWRLRRRIGYQMFEEISQIPKLGYFIGHFASDWLFLTMSRQFTLEDPAPRLCLVAS